MISTAFVVVFCLLLTTLHGVSSWKVYRRRPRGYDSARAPRQRGLGRQHLFGQCVIGLVLTALIVLADLGAADLGVKPGVAPVASLLAGIAVYLILLGVLEATSHVLGVRARLHDVSFEALRTVWPRERRGKPLAIVAVCGLNPVVEELLYRGILIAVFGELIGNVFVAAGISLVLSLFAHLYQGSLALLSQVLFHACAIGLLLSPLGLIASIGFHFAGDIVPVATMRAAMGSWATRRRARLRAAWP